MDTELLEGEQNTANAPEEWWIIVTGAFASGKTTFVRTISHYAEWQGTSLDNPNSRMIDLYRGTIAVDEELTLCLHDTPGSRHFNWMWDIIPNGHLLGVVILVDSGFPETFREARSILANFVAYDLAPYIIVANKQDKPNAYSPDELRAALRMPDDAHVLPCIATDKESVKNVLITLLEQVAQRIDRDAESELV